MDSRHKKILQVNRSYLVKELDSSKLYDALLSRGVFTQDMIDEIQSAGTRRDQARQLVKDLETRGKHAFPAFLECLREAGQEDIARMLQDGETPHYTVPTPHIPALLHLPGGMPRDLGRHDKGDEIPLPGVLRVPPQFNPNLASVSVQFRLILTYQCDTIELDDWSSNTPDFKDGPERESLKPPSRPRRDSLQCYRMEANPCGFCLIINNVDFEPQSQLKSRKGSDIDCEKLERRFRSLNFIVVVKKNLKQKQIRHELSTLSKKDHSMYDCCVVVILSHGTEATHSRFPGAVHGVDGPSVPVEIITSYLNGQHCFSLQSKPKLFFIQACGGDQTDTGFEVSPDEAMLSPGGVDDETDAMPTSSSSDSLSISDEADARATLPTPSDILVSYSTYPGYVSWRDTEAGSWYVETLDHVLGENAANQDLVTMLMMVNNEVSQISAKGLYKQMPGSFNFLRKLFYFQSVPTCQG